MHKAQSKRLQMKRKKHLKIYLNNTLGIDRKIV